VNLILRSVVTRTTISTRLVIQKLTEARLHLASCT
jgi:hypothetical protein